MARKDRGLAELETEKPGLEAWIEQRDRELDEQRDAQVRLADKGRWEKLVAGAEDDAFMRDGILGPLADVMTEHARSEHWPELRRRGSRRKKDPNVRFHDEIDAIRFWYSSQAEQRSGDLDRIAQRIKLGATIQTSTRNTEPTSDAYLEAVEEAIAAAGDDFEIVRLAHLEFSAPRQRTAGDLAEEDYARRMSAWAAADGDPNRGERPQYEPLRVPLRVADDLTRYDERQSDTQLRERFETFARWWRDGRKVKVGEETVELFPLTPIEITVPAASAMALAFRGEIPRGSELLADGLRWEHLVAERLGMNVSRELGPLDPKKDPAVDGDCRMTHLEASAREVRVRYSAARKRLRESLWRKELDLKPKWLIPAPTRKELESEAKDGAESVVECCEGIVIAGGLRQPCTTVAITGPGQRHPARGWKRCGVCRKPVAEVRDALRIANSPT